MVICGFILNSGLSYGFSTTLRNSVKRAGKKGSLAYIVLYSPMYLFPIILFGPFMVIQGLFDDDVRVLLIFFGWMVSLPPYFIFLLWYCEVKEGDINNL